MPIGVNPDRRALASGGPTGKSAWLAAAVLIALAVLPVRAHSAESHRPDAGGRHAGGAAPAVPVAVATVVLGDLPIVLEGLGAVSALRTVTVRSRVDGELVRIHFTEGQNVRPGDLLAEIDPRPFQIQLQQAEGQLRKDEALLRNAEVDLKRYRTLLDQDSIASQQTVTQESLVQQYLGTVEIDRAQVANARLQLTYARITAPIAGRVGLRLVDQGNIVRASDTNGLVVITQVQPIAVVFTLPEDQSPAVMKRWQAGARIPVEVFDRAAAVRLALGELLAVDNQIDASTGTFRLKAQVANDDGRLFPNQFVNARLRLDTLRGVPLVPTAAIQRGAIGAFVYVVKDDRTVTARPVKLGVSDNEKVAVSEGLKAAERVVVEGADKLREGATVDLVSAADGQGDALAKPRGAAAGTSMEGSVEQKSKR